MTVEEVARDALAAVGSEAGVLLAGRWVANRYQELCALGHPRHLRRVIRIELPAAIDVGLIAVVRGERRVYADADALEAWTATDIGGWFWRGKTSWYRVSGIGDEYLTLDAPFAEDDLGTVSGIGVDFEGVGYVLVKRFVSVPLRHILAASHPRRYQPIEFVSLEDMNRCAPERFPSWGGPVAMAEVGENSREKIIEFYPYSRDSEEIELVGYEAPPMLALREEIPASIDPYVLREGALIDVMRYEAGKAARSAQSELAAFWRNEYRAQETRWSDFKRHAYRTDLGIDDLGVVLQSYFPMRRGDIATARDEIYARGRRP